MKNSRVKLIFPKLFNFFLIFLIVYLPLSNFLNRYLSFRLGLGEKEVFVLTHFYEPLIFVLFVISVVVSLGQKKLGTNKDLKLLSLAVITYLIFLLLFLTPSLGRGIEGLRTSYLYLLFFFVSIVLSKNYNDLKKTYLIMAVLISILAIVERFLPYQYWRSLVGDNFGWGNFKAGGLERSASIFGGPLQLSSYLLPAAFLLFFKTARYFKNRNFRYGYAFLSAMAIVFLALNLAFSRAAILGAIIAFLIYLFAKIPSKNIKIALVISLVLAVAAFVVSSIYGPTSWQEFLRHGESNYWHLMAKRQTFELLKSANYREWLCGFGLGSHGPLAMKYSDGVVSESWYLQLLLEIGALGLLLWLSFVSLVSARLKKYQNQSLFYGLLAVLFMALFLHPFADNPALTFTIFILIGSYLNTKELKDKE